MLQIDTKPGGVISAKITPPTLRTPVLHRPRLYERLQQGLQRKAVIVAADAGFGKTTLLAGFLQTYPRRTIWYRLDPNDSDPATFLGYILAALKLQLRRRIPIDVSLAGSWDTATRMLVQALEGVRGECLLVLDDYHLLRHTPDVTEGMAFVVAHLPPSVHLALLTRLQVDLPLARWRAAEEILELGPDDLRFTPVELRELLVNLHGLALSDAALHLLSARTEGWAAGVILTLHALRARGVQEATQAIAELSGTSREIYDYMAQEAFDRQPQEVRHFLRATSVLSRFSADLADRLLDADTGRAIIRHLEASHLFVVPIDRRWTWYRYHHLFQEFLQRRLEEDEPEAIPDIHRRAGEVWEASGDALEAVQHYAACQQVEEVARILDADGEGLWVRGQFETLWSLIEQLPQPILKRHPSVAMLKGLLLRHFGKLEEAVIYLDMARRGLRGMGEAQATNYLGQTYMWLADHDRLQALATEVGSAERFRPEARARILDFLARAREVEGALHEAVSAYRQGIALARQAGDAWGEIRNARECAIVLGEIGDFDQAMVLQREGLLQTREKGWAHEAGHFATDLARTLMQLGRWAEGQRSLTVAEDRSRLGPCRRLLGEILHLKGELALQRGDGPAARASFEDVIRSAHEDPARVRLAGFLGLSRSLREDARGEGGSYAVLAVELGARISPYHHGLALLNLGTLEGNPEHVRQAVSLFQRCGARPSTALAQIHLAALRRSQDADESRRLVQEAIGSADSPERVEFLLAHETLPLLRPFIKDPLIGGQVSKFLAGFPQVLLPLYIRMLGPFEVHCGDREIPPRAFGRRATRQLFKYLLLHRRRPVTREEIMEALWPDSEPRRAANVLKARLSLLRRVLQPDLREGRPSAFLLARGGTLQFDTRSPHWIDLDEFERLAGRGEPSGLAEALDLYRGDLLEEDRYEEWTLAERDRVRTMYLKALASLASLHEEGRRIEASLTLWQRLVEHDPCAEQGYQGLIRCCLALGRRSDALRAFEQCRTRLRQELGVDPSPETQALLARPTSR